MPLNHNTLYERVMPATVIPSLYPYKQAPRLPTFQAGCAGSVASVAMDGAAPESRQDVALREEQT